MATRICLVLVGCIWKVIQYYCIITQIIFHEILTLLHTSVLGYTSINTTLNSVPQNVYPRMRIMSNYISITANISLNCNKIMNE